MTLTDPAAPTAGLDRLLAYRRFSAAPAFTADGSGDRLRGDPDGDAELLHERSPSTYIENVRTPLLVIQEATDPRVVRGDSDRPVEKLRELGRTVEYLVFEDAGHDFTERENAIAIWRAAAAWLERHLTPAPI